VRDGVGLSQAAKKSDGRKGTGFSRAVRALPTDRLQPLGTAFPTHSTKSGKNSRTSGPKGLDSVVLSARQTRALPFVAFIPQIHTQAVPDLPLRRKSGVGLGWYSGAPSALGLVESHWPLHFYLRLALMGHEPLVRESPGKIP